MKKESNYRKVHKIKLQNTVEGSNFLFRIYYFPVLYQKLDLPV